MPAHDTIINRLYLFPLSFTTIPLPGGSLEMVSSSYLIQTHDGRNILIDSGLPPDYIRPPNAPAPEQNKNILQWLHDVGLEASQIDTLICTHFDVDHVGYNELFVNATLVVQREHYEIAHSGHARYAVARSHWDQSFLKYHLVDGDVELVPGLTLLKTSGHAPAHQSVLLQLPNTGAVLLAIDAVVLQRLFTPTRTMWSTDDNQEELRASTQKLLDLVETEHAALVVFGHDGTQWKTLNTAPAFYD